MQEIEIRQQNMEIAIGYSSKGNQMKWYQDGYWYKADAFGYESLAEAIVSYLLSFAGKHIEYVVYEPVWIVAQGRRYRGCRSMEFKNPDEELVTLEHLHRSFTGQSLVKHLSYIGETRDKVAYTVEMVSHFTGIENFKEYLSLMLGMDAFFLNKDRHTNNIALLYDGKNDVYRCCPFFDMGLSLLSDTRQAYPVEVPVETCRKSVTAKPFCRDFDEQLDAAEELCSTFFHFELTKPEFLRETRAFLDREDVSFLYSEKERERVMEVLKYQAGKYLYMLK